MYLWHSEEGIRSCGAGIIGSCEPPDGDVGAELLSSARRVVHVNS